MKVKKKVLNKVKKIPKECTKNNQKATKMFRNT